MTTDAKAISFYESFPGTQDMFNPVALVSKGGNLMANENFCKAYSLKSIRYPTGGTRVFRYQMQGEMQFVPYGGLRIHKVVSYSSQNDSTVCEYQYSGSYATEPPDFFQTSRTR